MKRFLIALVAIILAAFTATAQPAAPAVPTPQADCKIGGITAGSLLEQNTKSVPFTLKTSGCKEIVSIEGDELVFTDFEFSGGKVTARVKAGDDTYGRIPIKLKDKSGAEYVSDSVSILVLDAGDAYNNKKAEAAQATAAKAAKQVKSLEQALASRPTTAEVRAIVAQTTLSKEQVEKLVADAVAPYQARIVALEQSQAATTQQVALLNRATVILANGQQALAQRRVGFFRRQLSKPVAASAANVAAALEKQPPLRTASN